MSLTGLISCSIFGDLQSILATSLMHVEFLYLKRPGFEILKDDDWFGRELIYFTK